MQRVRARLVFYIISHNLVSINSYISRAEFYQFSTRYYLFSFFTTHVNWFFSSSRTLCTLKSVPLSVPYVPFVPFILRRYRSLSEGFGYYVHRSVLSFLLPGRYGHKCSGVLTNICSFHSVHYTKDSVLFFFLDGIGGLCTTSCCVCSASGGSPYR